VLWFCAIHLLVARLFQSAVSTNLGVQPLNFKEY